MGMHKNAHKFIKKWRELYYDDPKGFANDVIGIELSPQQELVLEKLTEKTGHKSDRRVAVKSGHK